MPLPLYTICFFASPSSHAFSSALAADSPARYPVENAACRLYPPVVPSTSIISPQKNKSCPLRDSIVRGFISSNDTPPRVTVASSMGLGFLIFILKSVRHETILFRSSRLILLHRFPGSTAHRRSKSSANDFGRACFKYCERVIVPQDSNSR